MLNQQYPQTVVETLNSLGDSTLGFRMAGAPAEHAGADYIASQFSSMGLSDVRKEGVPVDAWILKGATLQVGDRAMVASQFPGIPGSAGPLTAPIVNVGEGRATDYVGQNVAGKLALIDIGFADYWWNLQGHEAKIQGAIGVVFTRSANTGSKIAMPDALYSEESRWGLNGPPAVFISRNDGQWLKNRINRGSTTATMSSDVQVTMHDFADPANGGLGFNVIGEIPGTDPDAKAILISAHHDAYFRAGLDNTGAVAQLLTIAKAMMVSGTRLMRTVIFLADTAEEFGYADTEYDYLAGVWYAATVTHASDAPDPWTGTNGRVALNVNLEESPQHGSILRSSATPDLVPWLTSVAAKWEEDLLPFGYYARPYYSTWHDGYAFTAAGVPSLVTVAETEDYPGMNHTQYDSGDLIDYAYLGNLTKLYYRLISDASEGLLPHDLDAQSADLSASISGTALIDAGANAATVDALLAGIQRYKTATAAYASRKASISSDRWAAVNDGLFSLERYWYSHLMGIDATDYKLIYPHEQTLSDIERITSAISHLHASPVEEDAALDDLDRVALTSTGVKFSPEVYAYVLRRRMPDYYLLTWGGDPVKQPWRVDITKHVLQVRNGDYAAAIDGLQAVVANELSGVDVDGYRGRVHFDGLDQRLAGITDALNVMTPMVNDLK